MKPIQLPSVCVCAHATVANYYPGANAAALGYVERLCEAEAGWAESLISSGDTTASAAATCYRRPACVRAVRRANHLPADSRSGAVRRKSSTISSSAGWSASTTWMCWLASEEWEGAVPPVQSTARYRSAPAAGGIEVARELRVKLPDLGSRLTMALIFQLHGLSDGTSFVPCNYGHPVVACI